MSTKVIKSGKMTPVTGGGKGFVGKQGGAAAAVSGRVSIPGYKKSSGSFVKGGPTGKVGKQGGVNRAKPGSTAAN